MPQHTVDSPEAFGRRTARRAIEAGLPRWALFNQSSDGSPIHGDTGLPIIVSSAVGEAATEQEAFVRGHNDEILRALAAGEITVDFRPFLPLAIDLNRLLDQGPLTLLTPGKPVLLERYDVRYEVFVPRPPRTPPRFKPPSSPYVRRIDGMGRHYVQSYEGIPIAVAIAPTQVVIALRVDAITSVYHAPSGQLLRRFAR